MPGRVTEGRQFRAIYDDSTFSTHHRNVGLHWTASETVETGPDASALNDSFDLVKSLNFAGIAFTDFPYESVADVLTSSWESTDYSTIRDADPAADLITVQSQCMCWAIPAEDISVGEPIMPTDVDDDADGSLHDGFVSPVDYSSPTQAELDSMIGIAMMATSDVDSVATTHDSHDDKWDHDAGDFSDHHPKIMVQLWR